MSKRAVIYIRTSSEKQAEKVSPEAQEADCRELCKRQGYEVVAVYRDTEKYRVGKRMVEPSGTRADRPQLKRMLADARAKKFDVIVAWREDRLYRASRPMLDVIDCLDETKIDIELAKETFDKRIAPVKAWAAKMELDARRDRITMGVAGRLAKGKVWLACIPFGYCAGPEQTAQINPDEAKWVQSIWQWKAERVSYGEIRKRLIEGNAPQRRKEFCRFPWQESNIQKILNNSVYHTGIQSITWGDKIHETPYPVLIDAETARRVREAIEQAKHQPIYHVTHDYLAIGFVKCAACKRVMCAYTSRMYRNGKPRNTFNKKYRCQNFMRGNKVPGCPHCANVNKIDAELWRKVNLTLSDDGNFEKRVQTRIDELQKEETDAAGTIERIKHKLSMLEEERQWVITQARKKSITDTDMTKQLGALDLQAQDLRHDLSDKSLLIGDRASRLIEFARSYREDLRMKLAFLNDESADSIEEKAKRHKGKREIIEAIVRTVWVYEDKSIQVEFEFDIPEVNPNPASFPAGASQPRVSVKTR